MTHLLAVLLALVQGPPPVIDIYSMGPGDDVFSRFGHSAICITDERTPEGRCFNYGTADFSSPGDLIWTFLRGRAKFWVSVSPLEEMIADYSGDQDRAMWRQRLPLTPDEAFAMRDRLENDLLPENRSYFYHHYNDNCTTRLRDHLDAVTGGKLRAATMKPYGATFRELTLVGYDDSVPLQIGVQLLLGRPADRQTTVWQAMFLPNVLRDEITKVYGVAPELVAERHHPLRDGDPRRGGWILWGLSLVLGAIVAFAPRRIGFRASLAIAGLLLGVLGLLFDGMHILSHLPELHDNELILVFWPTDLALPFLPMRWLRAYAGVRVVVLAIASLLWVAHVLHQPLAAPIALAALPLLAAFVRTRTWAA